MEDTELRFSMLCKDFLVMLCMCVCWGRGKLIYI